MSNVKVKSIISRRGRIESDRRNRRFRQCVRVASTPSCPLDRGHGRQRAYAPSQLKEWEKRLSSIVECCIYHKPHEFDESSSSDSEKSDWQDSSDLSE